MKLYKAIGLMSGTSMDGIDLSLIESDGKKIINRIHQDYLVYEDQFKAKLQHVIYQNPSLEEIKLVENELTKLHAELLNDFLKKNNISKHEIDLLSFHGHTIFHSPEKKSTWQIGNCHLLANLCGIDVVGDFRISDVVNNGQGAPLVPIYHFNLLQKDNSPTATLNIGGISNIAYFDDDNENNIVAFDVCFGNAPLDDLVRKKLNLHHDYNGQLAKNGNVDLLLADQILQNDIFTRKPPKSFDRDDFQSALTPIHNLKLEDALATFCYIHAKAIEINLDFLPNRPTKLYLCGGGRKNESLVLNLKEILSDVDVINIDDIGFDGDKIESEAFAYLAIRSILNLPISFHKTTGINKNKISQGILYKA
ncbi:MAG: anhydro-N-acetylmuramic acid kinase [Rickettsiales bacterium]|nr:anhydro-N-acetylmuramic acid kinase [Rickettsiales bacterium]